ncbi:MAG: hypothetical protein Q8M94_15080, partial [Ignavibacteria bacterium]|nr:hypothetical protein [Ignavibacteria bacterium]
ENMPIKMKCKLCSFQGNHGFVPTNGGLNVYHSENPDGSGQSRCNYYIGDDNEVYKTELELFKAVTMPTALKQTGNRLSTKIWCQARIATITGHPRKAEKLYNQWQKQLDGEGGET